MRTPRGETEAKFRNHRLLAAMAYGLLIGFIAFSMAIGITLLLLGPNSGAPALALLLAATAVLALAGGVAGGPILWRLEQRHREDH